MTEITLSTSCFFPDTELSFAIASDLGYDGVEVMVNHDRRSQTVESVLGLSTKYNIPIRSIHVPCLAISQHVWGWNPELKLKRSIEMAEAVGATTVVVHPPFRWQREYGLKFESLVESLQTKEGPSIAVENMYNIDALGRRINPYLCNDDPDFEQFSSVCLDTSHAAASRWDPIDMFERIGDRVSHIHLSDSTGLKGDEHLPPGNGSLPLTKLASKIAASNFSGQIVLEVAFQRVADDLRKQAAADALNWTRQAFSDTEKV